MEKYFSPQIAIFYFQEDPDVIVRKVSN